MILKCIDILYKFIFITLYFFNIKEVKNEFLRIRKMEIIVGKNEMEK